MTGGNKTAPLWPSEHDQIAIRMHAAGATAKQIGLRLGRTKNSVLGRLWRIAESRREGSPASRARERAELRKRLPIEHPETPASGECLFIFGHPAKKNGWHYCRRPTVLRSPFCRKHHAACYLTSEFRGSGRLNVLGVNQ